MFQGGLPHEPYFIAINNREQIIIGPSKKIVAIYVVGLLGTWGFNTHFLQFPCCAFGP